MSGHEKRAACAHGPLTRTLQRSAIRNVDTYRGVLTLLCCEWIVYWVTRRRVCEYYVAPSEPSEHVSMHDARLPANVAVGDCSANRDIVNLSIVMMIVF